MRETPKNKDIIDEERYEENIKNGIKEGVLAEFSSLEELKKLEDACSDFLIILAHATFEWKGEKTVKKEVTIELPSLSGEKKYIVACDERGRRLLEGRYISPKYSSFNIPWERKAKKFLLEKRNGQKLQLPFCRWAAGGAIPVLEFENGDKYVALIRRDKTAPIHPQHLTTASGLSEHWKELIDPRIIIGREFGEEIIIINKSGIIYRYNFKLSENEEGNEDVKELQRYYEEEYEGKIESFKNELKENYGIKIDKEEDVEAKIIPLGEDSIKINLDKNNREIKGACVLDPIFGAVDVIGAVLVKFNDVKPREIQVLDFDTKEKRPSCGRYKFMHRNIFLIKIPEKPKDDKEDLRNLIEGKKFRCTIFHKQLEREKPLLTPPLRATLTKCYRHFVGEQLEYGYMYSESIPVEGIGDEERDDEE